jgi:hypothetical protein
MDRAAPEESRGGPIIYLDADEGDLVPTSRSGVFLRLWVAIWRKP